MSVRKKRKISSYPPCDDDAYAVDRAKRESRASTLGYVTERFQAMVGDAAKAAYSRTYVNEYRRAWDKDWPYLYEMLEIIETEQSYDKPWLKDGVPMPTYPTFQAYCEAEVEPFVGPIASLRERYLELKDGKIDVEGGARQQRRACTIAICRKAYQELRDEGSKVTQQAVADRAGVSRELVKKYKDEIGTEMSTDDTSVPRPTKSQSAVAAGISRGQLHRIETVAKHRDLQKRTELPKSDPQHLSIAKAFLGASLREGRRPDPVEPIRRALMKLDHADRRRAVEWVISWAKENGDLNDAS